MALPGKSAFRVNPVAATCQALGTYVLEQSTAKKRAVAISNLPMFAYIYSNRGMKISKNAHPDITTVLESLTKPKVIYTGAIVGAAIFWEVSVEKARRIVAASKHPNVVVLNNATQILHLSKVFPFKPVFIEKRPAPHRESDKRFQLFPHELAECNKRLKVVCMCR